MYETPEMEEIKLKVEGSMLSSIGGSDTTCTSTSTPPKEEDM